MILTVKNPLLIIPISKPINAEITVPGSKSITNRALLLAALAQGNSRLSGALFSDDTRFMAGALNELGIAVRADEAACVYAVEGNGGDIPASRAELFLGNSGTSIRFLTAFCALGNGEYRLDGVARMRQRPIGDLLDALGELGLEARAENGDDCPPIIIRGNGLRGGQVRMRADLSSQYLSALLMVAPLCQGEIEIEIEGELSSQPYIEMTLRMMRQWGAEVEHQEYSRFRIKGGQHFRAKQYSIEPDASGASYFFAAAAITNGRVRVPNLNRDSLQGDTGFVEVLRQMGCEVEYFDKAIEVRGAEVLRGVEIDMNAISDTVMTLAAIAPFAESPTHIRNIGHIRHKETDRIHALATELNRLGVRVEESADSLTIYPARELKPANIETYDDHRMAMSFAITGLRAPGVSICDPDCVNKTFPDFWERWEKLRTI